MEADGADGGYEDDDGDDDSDHPGQHGVGLPGVLGSHPTPGIILEAALEAPALLNIISTLCNSQTTTVKTRLPSAHTPTPIIKVSYEVKLSDLILYTMNVKYR